MRFLDYEQLGTNAVVSAVSKTSRLKAHVNSGDKEPSFDGNIYIYDNDSYSKNNLKRVSVQVKGKGVSSKPAKTIKYRIDIVDLDNYLRNGGVMFFVVYVDKETGDLKQIYYSSLLPFKIKEILKGKIGNGKKISVNFKKFPNNVKEITELFLNFYEDAQQQISFIGKNLPTIEDLQKNGLLESLSFSYISTEVKNDIINYPKLFDGKELYIYANIKDGIAPIPVDYYSQISQVQVSCTDDISVGVNGKIYYTYIEKTITAEKIICGIGSSLTLSWPNVDATEDDLSNLKIKISIQLKGTLKQRIEALEFLIAMFDAQAFDFGRARLPVIFSAKQQKSFNSKFYSELLCYYKRVLAVLEKLNVKKDLPLDNFTKEEYRKLDALVGAIESETPVQNIKDEPNIIVYFNFGGLHLIMICLKQKDGVYKLWDYFDKHIDVYAFSENQERFVASQYSIMKADDFLTVDNLRLQSIIDDFRRIKPQECIVENGNMILLEMLKAYDHEEKPELLNAVKQMHSWLEAAGEYINSEVMLINHFQIIRRERELTFAERRELYKLIDSSDNITYKIGALILLNEQDEAERLLSKISLEDKETFMSYPIFKFYTKS